MRIGVLARGHDEAALGVELEGVPEGTGHLGPELAAQQGKVELRTGLLVGDEDVALTPAGRASRDGTAIDDDDAEPGLGACTRTAGTDHAGPDDDNVGDHAPASRCCAQIPRT